MASLFVISENKKEVRYFPLGKAPMVVGRGETVPIQVVDKQVSRKHVQIRYDAKKDNYVAINMKSRNGVFINGMLIAEETVLSERDRIKIGDTYLVFTFKDFPDRQSALYDFKKGGESKFTTL